MKGKIIYTKYSDERKKEYAVQTTIVITEFGKIVKKKAIFSEGKSHIKRMAENCQILTAIYGKEHVAQCLDYSDEEVCMEYVEGELLSKVLERFLTRHEYDDYEYMLGRYIAFLKKSCIDDKSEYVFEENDLLSTDRLSNIDMIFDNIILRDNEFVIIDYEWLVPKIDYKIVLYRVLSLFYLRAKNRQDIKRMNEKYELFKRGDYEKINEKFVADVMDEILSKYKKEVWQPSIVNSLELQKLKEIVGQL